jgi:hypothetical protein
VERCHAQAGFDPLDPPHDPAIVHGLNAFRWERAVKVKRPWTYPSKSGQVRADPDPGTVRDRAAIGIVGNRTSKRLRVEPEKEQNKIAVAHQGISCRPAFPLWPTSLLIPPSCLAPSRRACQLAISGAEAVLRAQ